MKKYQLNVKNIIPETDDAISVVFEHPTNEKILYKPGQFLTLIVDIAGKKERRAYSLCSCPYTDEDLKINIKRVQDGKISNLLNNVLKVGDILEVLEPMGVFVPHLNSENNKNYLLWASGSGITPLFSMVKAILHSEPQSNITLVYANRNEESIIFKQELNTLEQDYPQLKVVHILSQPSASWQGHQGRLTEVLAEKIILDTKNNQPLEQFMCGVIGMMETVVNVSKKLSLPVPHKENFIASIEEAAKIPIDTTQNAGKFIVKVSYDGQTHEFGVSPSETILEAAIAADIDLPYSCQSGLCTACMGRCTSGKVKMTEDDCLTDQELKDGWILTCVTHPVDGNISIVIE